MIHCHDACMAVAYPKAPYWPSPTPSPAPWPARRSTGADAGGATALGATALGATAAGRPAGEEPAARCRPAAAETVLAAGALAPAREGVRLTGNAGLRSARLTAVGPSAAGGKAATEYAEAAEWTGPAGRADVVAEEPTMGGVLALAAPAKEVKETKENITSAGRLTSAANGGGVDAGEVPNTLLGSRGRRQSDGG